jgi:hypothetical protein
MDKPQVCEFDCWGVKGHVVGEGGHGLGNHDRHDELLRPYTLEACKASPQSLFAPQMYI